MEVHCDREIRGKAQKSCIKEKVNHFKTASNYPFNPAPVDVMTGAINQTRDEKVFDIDINFAPFRLHFAVVQ